MPEQFEVLKDLITTQYLCRLFNRGELTIMAWRHQGGLPFVKIPGTGRDTIRYRLQRVVNWARSAGKEFDLVVLKEVYDGDPAAIGNATDLVTVGVGAAEGEDRVSSRNRLITV